MLKKYFIILNIFLVSCFETVEPNSSLVGSSFPEFNLYTEEGKTVFNTKQIKEGQPILLYFLSPDCPVCRIELKEIIEHMEQLKNTKIILVTPVSESKFISFCKEYELNKYNNIIAGIDKKNYLVKNLNIQNVPYIATFNKEKKLTHIFPRRAELKEIFSAVYDKI